MRSIKRSLNILLVSLILCHPVTAEVQRKIFSIPSAYMIVEVLDDDLLHFEISATGSVLSVHKPLYASPMVFNTDYPGPSAFSVNGDIIETADVRLEINSANLCIKVKDRKKANAYLTALCPDDLNMPFKGLNIDPGAIKNIYGLGQQFTMLGSSDGDWIAHGVREGIGNSGNAFQGFQEAAVGNVQFPVMYALGNDNLNYALFIDNIYKQKWDFNAYWWKVRMFGDQIRFYLMTGSDLPDLRSDYMELTGRPPVPPRKAFGMWVSEFGYDNWDQIDSLLTGLRDNRFPVDGFVLDLNWFGGVELNNPSKSRMGRLNWDEDNNDGNGYYFPAPDLMIQQLASKHIGLTAIEESYISNSVYTDTYTQMPAEFAAFQRTNGRCDPGNQSATSEVSGFWGTGKMIDWSDPAAGKWIHDNRRYPNLSKKGVNSHWTDLGEPENYNGMACYEGAEVTAAGMKNEHSDIHNLYNLLWNRAIWDGYFDKRGQANNLGIVNPRPFIVTRSGASGTQRYGTAMWSGDIAANLRSLSTHANAQMHMSFSGIDYYGSDAGGFRREVLPHNNKKGEYRGYDEENYTQWFANSAWFDVPLRPHTDNEFIEANPPYATAPHLAGKKASNHANIIQRYELIPYYYSLAYRASLFGEPVMPPLVFYYQNDPNVRKTGHEKMIGRNLLVGIVSSYGEYERDMYLPPGKWINYHTNEWFTSSGQVLRNIPVYRSGVFRLPVFARAGAIIPLMHVDENTIDAFGNPSNNSVQHNDLIVKVYADDTPSAFTLYEDDGMTLQYQGSGRPFYHYRTTEISQKQTGNKVVVTVHPALNVNSGSPFAGAVSNRRNVIKLSVSKAEASGVSLNGSALTQHSSESSFKASDSGWFNAGSNLILAKSGFMDVYTTTKKFTVTIQPKVPATSVYFVCDKGATNPGESVYVAGSTPVLGGPSWDSDKAVKLDPDIYYEYIWNPPQTPNHPPDAPYRGAGPSAPVWTGVISGLPPNTRFEWKCIRKREDGSGGVQWQPGDNNVHTTTSSGYAGRSYGSF